MLESVARQSGKRSEMLTMPTIPPNAEYLLEVFFRLNSSRKYASSGFGATPMLIEYSELQAFTVVADMPLDPLEVEFIKQMDFAYIAAVSDKSK